MASEYLKWKYRDVEPERPVELTKKQRRQNWWHYHKWHVLAGAVLVLAAASWAWNALTQVYPDYQIAYVGSSPLPEEDTAAWEARLAFWEDRTAEYMEECDALRARLLEEAA